MSDIIALLNITYTANIAFHKIKYGEFYYVEIGRNLYISVA